MEAVERGWTDAWPKIDNITPAYSMLLFCKNFSCIDIKLFLQNVKNSDLCANGAHEILRSNQYLST